MAIILKNPMPMNGALFITNPRKKARKSKSKTLTLSAVMKGLKKSGLKRRKNAGAGRTKAKYIVQALKGSASPAQIASLSDAAFRIAVADGKAAQDAVRAEKAAAGGALKWLTSRPKGKKMFTASAAQIDAVLARMGKSKGKDTNRLTALERRQKLGISSTKQRTASAKAATAAKAKTTSAKKSTGAKKGRFNIAEFNRQRRLMAEAARAPGFAPASEEDLKEAGLVSNPRRRKSRSKKNPWFNAKGPDGGHAGAAYIRWGKTSKGKQLLARYHKSKGRTLAAASSAGKKNYGAIFAAVSAAYKNRNFKSAKARMQAIHKEVRKRMNASVSSATARTSAQRTATRAKARRLNEYQKVNKMFGGLGLSTKQIRKAYEELSFLEQKQVVKEIKSLKKKSGESEKAFQKRVRTAANNLIKDPMRDLAGRKVALNPRKPKSMRKRRNPIAIRTNKGLGVIRSGVDKVGLLVQEKVPFIGKTLAPIVVSGLFGYGIYKVHTAVEPFALPLVEKGLNAISFFPPARWAAERVALNPYLTLGAVVSIAAGLAAKKGLVTSANASWLGGLAVVSGVVLDQSLQPFAKAAAKVVVETEGADAVIASSPAQAGLYGDGGAYIIGAPSQALGAIGENLSGIDREYADAVLVDAYACSDTMHPDEVAAILAGDSYFVQKFGHSPGRVRKSPSDYSRHAGRPGHRFGWLIKMVGFANLQKIAALPASQRESVIRKLREQACASAPAMIAAAQAESASAVESASLMMDNTFNGACGFQDMGYGSLIFAGSDY